MSHEDDDRAYGEWLAQVAALPDTPLQVGYNYARRILQIVAEGLQTGDPENTASAEVELSTYEAYEGFRTAGVPLPVAEGCTVAVVHWVLGQVGQGMPLEERQAQLATLLNTQLGALAQVVTIHPSPQERPTPKRCA